AMTLSTCNFSLPAAAHPHGAASMRDALPASIRQTERLRMQSRVTAPQNLPSLKEFSPLRPGPQKLTRISSVFCQRSLVLAPGGLPSQLVVYVPAGDQPPSSNINSGKRDTTTMYPFIRLQQDLSGSLVTRNKPQILAVFWQCALPCADGISVLVPASGGTRRRPRMTLAADVAGPRKNKLADDDVTLPPQHRNSSSLAKTNRLGLLSRS
ncbi:RNA polymerase II C-terminal domain phosphatase-like 3, partial [Dissostichus eleginoides]